jgi:hypothetical protein
MAATWEYKTLTVKHSGGGLQLTYTPTDDEATVILNAEGLLGWELVSAVCPGISQSIILFFKRPR